MIEPKLYDVVETLYVHEESGVPAGSQGTLVADYGDGAFEIEFVDELGETLKETWKVCSPRFVAILMKIILIVHSIFV